VPHRSNLLKIDPARVTNTQFVPVSFATWIETNCEVAMRRVTLKNSRSEQDEASLPQTASRQPTPLQMMLAGSTMSVLGFAAFLIGIYGSASFTMPAVQPALAQAAPVAAPKPVAATEAEPEQQGFAEVSDEVISSSDPEFSDEIVPEEKFESKSPPPPPNAALAQQSDSFNTGDDPWAALEPAPPAANPGEAPPSDAPAPAE
jgi:hypothetical protein